MPYLLAMPPYGTASPVIVRASASAVGAGTAAEKSRESNVYAGPPSNRAGVTSPNRMAGRCAFCPIAAGGGAGTARCARAVTAGSIPACSPIHIASTTPIVCSCAQ
jgi:hypothetical protein